MHMLHGKITKMRMMTYLCMYLFTNKFFVRMQPYFRLFQTYNCMFNYVIKEIQIVSSICKPSQYILYIVSNKIRIIIDLQIKYVLLLLQFYEQLNYYLLSLVTCKVFINKILSNKSIITQNPKHQTDNEYALPSFQRHAFFVLTLERR